MKSITNFQLWLHTKITQLFTTGIQTPSTQPEAENESGTEVEKTFREFTQDDKAYQRWLQENPNGYVINTPRDRKPGYMVLHRASCRTIKQYNRMAQPGGFTERDYIKICANDIASLRSWVKANGRRDGSFSNVCGLCKPSANPKPGS